MAQSIVIHTVKDFEKVALVCETFTDADCFPLDITIKKHTSSIVSAQRGLYWRWLTKMIITLGGTKEELHEEFKERVFLNTYIADIENHPTFEGIVDAMQIVKAQAPGEYPTIRAMVMHGVSHLDATKDNWRDILTYVEVVANDHKIKLPVSDKKGVR